MKSENINTMFQRHLDPAESLFYPDFLNDLCKHIVSLFVMVSLLEHIYAQ